ncbi:IS3 family transposase [Paraburkholderia hayleyella]|uniref:IS3 family transposase n=1 Tax=Paraburkholderia hayleyella TaxID=2152889 RepID=UPI001292164D|nr:IS3 family transposase [Paraburkholderia hayleyella]
MTKYDEAVKLQVVQEYLDGRGGLRHVSQKHGIGYSVLRRWVGAFRQHGEAGLRKKHETYSAEFKMSVLQHMWRHELSYQHTCAVFDLREANSVSRWERQYHEGGLEALKPRPRGRPPKMSQPKQHTQPTTPGDERPREDLLKEIEYLRAEVAYLKKGRAAPGQGADSAKEKAQAVSVLREHHPLGALLSIAGLARSTFYYQMAARKAGDHHAELKARISQIFARHKGRYGYRRVTAALRKDGSLVNHKTVQRLMSVLRLKSLVRPKKYRSYRGELGRVAPNLLKRQFEASKPNEKWVTDVTEFNVGGKKLYLSPVLDLYNGEIIAWESSERPDFALIQGMLDKAFRRLSRGQTPMLHSDQGWAYQMRAYRERLAKRGLVQSMSRKGNCLDNAAMESFFGTLKSECFRLARFDCVEQLRSAIANYIHYYNHERIKLKLKGLSPVQYRTQPLAA